MSESNCKSLHADLCKEDSLFDNDMIVTSNEIEDIIKDLDYNKSPGLNGISSDHMKCAGQQLPVLLSILMSAIIVHVYVPKSSMLLFRSLKIRTHVLQVHITFRVTFVIFVVIVAYDVAIVLFHICMSSSVHRIKQKISYQNDSAQQSVTQL